MNFEFNGFKVNTQIFLEISHKLNILVGLNGSFLQLQTGANKIYPFLDVSNIFQDKLFNFLTLKEG